MVISCVSSFLRHLRNQWPCISLRGHSGSSILVPIESAHTNSTPPLCTPSIVGLTASIYYLRRDVAVYWSKIATPLVFGAPVVGEAVRFTQQPLVKKNRMIWAYQTVKEFRWYVQPFWYKSRVWQTEWETELPYII